MGSICWFAECSGCMSVYCLYTAIISHITEDKNAVFLFDTVVLDFGWKLHQIVQTIFQNVWEVSWFSTNCSSCCALFLNLHCYSLSRNTPCLYSRWLILLSVAYREHRHDGWCSWTVLTIRTWDVFILCYGCVKSLEQNPLSVQIGIKIGINYSQAIIGSKLMKCTVLYTGTMKRGKKLMKKS